MAEDKFESARRGFWCEVFMQALRTGSSAIAANDAANVALDGHDAAFRVVISVKAPSINLPAINLPAINLPAKKPAVKKAR